MRLRAVGEAGASGAGGRAPGVPLPAVWERRDGRPNLAAIGNAQRAAALLGAVPASNRRGPSGRGSALDHFACSDTSVVVSGPKRLHGGVVARKPTAWRVGLD
jgi:hypothetical protein